MLTEELGNGRRFDSKERLDVAFQHMFPTSAEEREDEIQSLTESYHKYKREYVKHLSFTPDGEFLSKYTLRECEILFSATMLDHNPLEAVYIYFDTATYDEIEKDEKVIVFLYFMSIT